MGLTKTKSNEKRKTTPKTSTTKFSTSQKNVQLKPKRHKARRSILKGPKTAWIFYCNEHRKKLLRKNPAMSFGDICKELSPLWENTSDVDRRPYTDLSEEDKIRYNEQKKNLPQNEKTLLKMYKKEKRADRKNKPKLVLSPYMFFVMETRPTLVKNNKTATFQTIGKMLGNAWRMLSPEDKAIYENRNRVDKIRYEKEMVKYNQEKGTRNPS